MYLLICQFFSLVGIASIIVLFFGYWLSTDYYFKFINDNNGEHVPPYILVNASIAFFIVILATMLAATHQIEKIYILLPYIYGTACLVYCSIYFLIFINVYFQRSRKYFAKKRNRSI